MTLYLIATLGTVLAGAIAVLWSGARRWGAELVRDTAGDGAYRSGGVLRQVARGVPRAVAIATTLAWLWAGVTAFVLVPAGVLLALLGPSARGIQSFAMCFGPAAAVASGCVLVYGLAAVGRALAAREAGAAERARSVARYSRWHHGAAWVGFALLFCIGPPAASCLGIAAALAVPCGIGFLVALVLDAAATKIEALDAADQLELVDEDP